MRGNRCRFADRGSLRGRYVLSDHQRDAPHRSRVSHDGYEHHQPCDHLVANGALLQRKWDENPHPAPIPKRLPARTSLYNIEYKYAGEISYVDFCSIWYVSVH